MILGMPGAAPLLLSHVALGYASDALIAALEDACCLGGASEAGPAGPPPTDQQPLRWPRHREQRRALIPDACVEDMEAVLPMVRGGRRLRARWAHRPSCWLPPWLASGHQTIHSALPVSSCLSAGCGLSGSLSPATGCLTGWPLGLVLRNQPGQAGGSAGEPTSHCGGKPTN